MDSNLLGECLDECNERQKPQTNEKKQITHTKKTLAPFQHLFVRQNSCLQ